jgi:hypothetical protein
MALTEVDWQLLTSPGGRMKSIDGGSVASVAGTQPAVTGLITRITGTEAIVTLTLPYAEFSGTIILIPLAAFTWTAAGNIAVLGTAVAYKALHMTYCQATSKWYPSYV